jgi:outer membrane beta-barrel protein
METRLRVLLLTLVAAGLAGCAHLPHVWPFHHKDQAARGEPVTVPGESDADEQPVGDEPEQRPAVIDQRVARRKIKVPKIDASNIEIGGYFGEISIEDFGAEPVAGLQLDYHVTEDFFFEARYGRAKAGKTSFELLNGDVQLLTDAERQFTYYSLGLGYNFLPGEIFIGRKLAMTSSLYLVGGIGSAKFAGQQNFAVNFGAGFRVLPTDWLAIHIGMEDLIFKSDLLGVDRLKNNLQGHIGATVYF